MHNFLGHDGAPPSELRAAARADLAGYDTVTVRTAAVASVGVDGDGFRVVVGDEEVTTRGLVLATGVRDTLPDVPGLAMLPSGCVHVDAMGRTSVPGVHAAGDMAHVPELAMPLASVLTAAASRLVAGAAMAAYLL